MASKNRKKSQIEDKRDLDGNFENIDDIFLPQKKLDS
jgi:hypothetical protein